MQKRNGPQIPIRIMSDDRPNGVAVKADVVKINNELPQKKKAPPPPPMVRFLILSEVNSLQ